MGRYSDRAKKYQQTQEAKGLVGVKITCQRCGKSWKTYSQGYYVTCPRCMSKVKIPGRSPPKRLEPSKENTEDPIASCASPSDA